MTHCCRRWPSVVEVVVSARQSLSRPLRTACAIRRPTRASQFLRRWYACLLRFGSRARHCGAHPSPPPERGHSLDELLAVVRQSTPTGYTATRKEMSGRVIELRRLMCRGAALRRLRANKLVPKRVMGCVEFTDIDGSELTVPADTFRAISRHF